MNDIVRTVARTDRDFYLFGYVLQIDWEESSLVSGGVAVKSGVNEDLDELRRTYAGLPDFLVCRPSRWSRF